MAATKQDPQTALLNVLERYRQTTEMHPAASLLRLDTGFHETFLRVLHHDYNTVKARSQALDDHEITITQMAFKILMENERDHHAAIQIYVEELLGVRFGSVPDLSSMIKDAVHVRAALLDGKPRL